MYFPSTKTKTNQHQQQQTNQHQTLALDELPFNQHQNQDYHSWTYLALLGHLLLCALFLFFAIKVEVYSCPKMCEEAKVVPRVSVCWFG